MKNIILIITTIILVSINSIVFAQQTAGSSEQLNFSVGATPVAVITRDLTVISWTIHPENGNIRCVTRYPGITYAPTASVGFEVISGSYLNNSPYSPAYLEQDCVAETGTVSVSVCRDHK